MSPLLFCVYVDGIIGKLSSSKLGCWIGDCYVACVTYADDLVCELQKMIDVRTAEATKINVQFYPNKCAVCNAGLVPDTHNPLCSNMYTRHTSTCYCRPYLLYATECAGLSVSHMRSLRNTWQCAVSRVFNVMFLVIM